MITMQASDRISAWIENQYCASVAATLQARAEYFELLADAMVSPVRLVRALSTWRQHATQTEVLGGLVAAA
jgi:hypothetical protein